MEVFTEIADAIMEANWGCLNDALPVAERLAHLAGHVARR